METTEELKKIKKIYGEKFMHLCRSLFPTLLETEGKLLEILSQSFGNNSRSLYEDIVDNKLEEELKNFVYSKIDMESSDKKIIVKKTPYELLDEAGYNLFECKSEKEIQSFKKYYAKGEELCTFHGDRLETCEVFFAVRKDVDEIRREDYTEPKREDRYGTSVMSIQFNREGMCTVSIKNRYNHRVNNPDATYGNDLEKIAPGLEQSFADLLAERGLELNNSNVEKFAIPGYVVAGDGRYYKYNVEKDGVYYCPGNIVIENGEIKQLKDNEILIDDFVVDIKDKTIKEYREGAVKDSFVDAFTDIDRIDVTKNKEKGTRTITVSVKDGENPITIEINNDNAIIGYSNKELRSVGDSFMYSNVALKNLDLPQLQKVGGSFLLNNVELESLELSQLQLIDDLFLASNAKLSSLYLPQVKSIGNSFLYSNDGLKSLDLPQVETTGDYFLYFNEELESFEAPQLQEVGNKFLASNMRLIKLDLPKLQTVGCNFLSRNKELRKIDFPKLQNIGFFFLHNNMLLRDSFSKDTIDCCDIAKLDKATELTTSEIGWGERIIGKIKTALRNIFDRNDDRDSR